MSEIAIGGDPADDDVLTREFADDEMEIAAGAEGDPEYSAYQTIVYATWSSTCPCGC